MRSLRRGSSALLAVLLASVCASGPAAPQAPPEPAAPQAEGASDLYLEVFLDGVSTNLVAAFVRRADGSFEIEPEELAEIGLVPDSSALTADGMVALDRLPSVAFEYDEATQTMRFAAAEEARAAHVLDLEGDGDDPEHRRSAQADWGALVNYTLFANAGGEQMSDISDFEGVSGALDARIFGPLGVLSSSAIGKVEASGENEITRLDTTWAWSEPERMLTFRGGDLISGGLAWTRPVRLAGAQAQRNFALRPDLITLPLPEFADSAAVPSTLDVFSSGGLVYSGTVPAGPFVAQNVPVVAGAGRARIVLTDALGRETVSERAFYVAPGMLRPGLFDFSIEAGVPRRSYGTESFDYDESWAASASARYGLRGGFTLEGHAEVMENVVNVGAGGIFAIGHLGAGSLALAGSQSDDGQGLQAAASVEFALGGVTLFGRAQRMFGDYRDIASFASEGNIFDRLPPKALEQISASFPLTFDTGVVSLGAAHIERADGDESLLATFAYSRPLFGSATLNASAFADIGDDGDFGGYVGFSMPLGGRTSVATGLDVDRDSFYAVADIVHAESPEPGSIGWRVRAGIGDEADQAAGASLRTRFGRIEANVAHSDAQTRATAQFDGAFVLAGGGAFAVNRVDDAFAVVNVGAPGVDVLYENNVIGTTGRSGRVVVPGLRSYEANRIAIDPANLPIDAVVPATEEIVVPAARSGVTVGFGVSTDVASALVEFRGADGSPIEAGSTGTLDDGSSFFVGYDGQAYVTGLQSRNSASITRPDGATCVAQFDFAKDVGTQALIPGVSCVPL